MIRSSRPRLLRDPARRGSDRARRSRLGRAKWRDDLDGVRRGADHVGERLHGGRAVDVADARVGAGVLLRRTRRTRRAGSRRRASSRPSGRASRRSRVGFRIFAVSAMKWTPQNAITSRVDVPAACASASESPTWSARSWISRLLVVVREQDGVALVLEAPDRVLEVVGELGRLSCGGSGGTANGSPPQGAEGRLEDQRSDAARVAAHAEHARAGPAPRAHLGDVEARLEQARARGVRVADAPRDAPGAVRRRRVRACDELAATSTVRWPHAEEHQAAPQSAKPPVEREAEAERVAVERARRLGSCCTTTWSQAATAAAGGPADGTRRAARAASGARCRRSATPRVALRAAASRCATRGNAPDWCRDPCPSQARPDASPSRRAPSRRPRRRPSRARSRAGLRRGRRAADAASRPGPRPARAARDTPRRCGTARSRCRAPGAHRATRRSGRQPRVGALGRPEVAHGEDHVIEVTPHRAEHATRGR